MSDTKKSIGSSARLFSLGTLFSRFTGMGRDMAMAFFFGSHPSVAALMMASRFAQFFRRFLGEGALQSAFVPHFELLRGENEEQARKFFRDLRLSLFLVLLLVVSLSMFGLWGVLAFVPLKASSQEVLWLTLILCPCILFICLWGLNQGLLQSERRYFLTGIIPAIVNVVWIGAVLYLGYGDAKAGMPYLAAALVFAFMLAWLASLPATRQIIGGNVRGTPFSPAVRAMIKPILLGMIGVSASQINSVCDVLFARFADISGPAYLWYALRLEQLPLAVFGIALSSALLPPLSRASRDEDWGRYGEFLQFGMLRSFQLMLACTFFLLVCGPALVSVLYGRGDFDYRSTCETLFCLFGYALGLVSSTWVLLLGPAFYARKSYRIPTLMSVLSVSCNLVMNYVFIAFMSWGPWSVALATSLSSVINFSGLAWAFYKETGVCIWSGILRELVGTGALLLLLSSGALYLSFQVLPSLSILPLLDPTLDFDRGFTTQFLGFTALFVGFWGGVMGLWYGWLRIRTGRRQSSVEARGV